MLEFEKTIKVTELEMKFVTTLIDSLYAEAGFSDVGIDEIAQIMKVACPVAKGVMGSLVKKGIVDAGDDEFPVVNLHTRVYHLHKRWWEESGGFGMPQVALKV